MSEALSGPASSHERLGDAEIEPRLLELMRSIAADLDGLLNRGLKGKERVVGFALLVFPFEGHEGRCNYVSNAQREDIVVLLKEQLARFEGQPEAEGHA